MWETNPAHGVECCSQPKLSPAEASPSSFSRLELLRCPKNQWSTICRPECKLVYKNRGAHTFEFGNRSIVIGVSRYSNSDALSPVLFESFEVRGSRLSALGQPWPLPGLSFFCKIPCGLDLGLPVVEFARRPMCICPGQRGAKQTHALLACAFKTRWAIGARLFARLGISAKTTGNSMLGFVPQLGSPTFLSPPQPCFRTTTLVQIRLDDWTASQENGLLCEGG